MNAVRGVLFAASVAVGGCAAGAHSPALTGTVGQASPPGVATPLPLSAPAQPDLRPIQVAGAVPFTISLPSGWALQDTVFMDGATKVAELSPGAVLLPGDDGCARWPLPPPAGDGIRVLRQTALSLGGLHGVRRTERELTEGPGGAGGWYPVAYCLQRGHRALFITFYAPTASRPELRLFDRIAATVTFTPAPAAATAVGATE